MRKEQAETLEAACNREGIATGIQPKSAYQNGADRWMVRIGDDWYRSREMASRAFHAKLKG